MNRSNDRLKHKRFGSCTHQLRSRGEGSSVVPRVKTQKVVEFTRSARSGAPEPPELPWAPRFAVIRVCKVSVWGLTLTLVLLHQGECSIVVARLAALGSFGSSSCYRLRRIKRRLFQKHRPECQTFTKKKHSFWVNLKETVNEIIFHSLRKTVLCIKEMRSIVSTIMTIIIILKWSAFTSNERTFLYKINPSHFRIWYNW